MCGYPISCGVRMRHSEADMSTADPNLVALELQRPYLERGERGAIVVNLMAFVAGNPAGFRRWVDACRELRRRKRMLA